jgi:2-polyprenyl-3-methyl-5-hydroxy-6-metoxy-1,4-benzoquinol methylase
MQTYTKSFSNCPICNSSRLKLAYDFDDFSVIKCRSCANSWRSNMYDSDKIIELYCSDEYESHPYFSYDIDAVKTLSKKRFQNYRKALNYLESIHGVGKLLDVACGSGAFISIAQSRGWSVDGVEISPALCNACKSNSGISVVNATFEEASLPYNYYDVITFWDIIEHVTDPIFCIEKARSLLKPGGLILFCTPDEDSLLARIGWLLYKFSGASYSYPALALHPTYHTYFFSRSGFTKILEKQGFLVTSSYSQEAYFDHSPLASSVQKKAIALIEKIASYFDSSYEFVIMARRLA